MPVSISEPELTMTLNLKDNSVELHEDSYAVIKHFEKNTEYSEAEHQCVMCMPWKRNLSLIPTINWQWNACTTRKVVLLRIDHFVKIATE